MDPLPWLYPTDHKRLAALHLVAAVVLSAAVAATTVGLGRADRLDPQLTPNGFFYRLALHAFVAVHFVAVPGVFSVFGNYLVPLMAGSRGLAVRWLGPLGWYLFLAGCGAAGTALWFDSGTGIPHTTSPGARLAPVDDHTRVLLVGSGTVSVHLSVIVTVGNLIGTIICRRATGLRWWRMPTFLWAVMIAGTVAVATSVGQVLTLIATLTNAHVVAHLHSFICHTGPAGPLVAQLPHLVTLYAVAPAIGLAAGVLLGGPTRSRFGICVAEQAHWATVLAMAVVTTAGWLLIGGSDALQGTDLFAFRVGTVLLVSLTILWVVFAHLTRSGWRLSSADGAALLGLFFLLTAEVVACRSSALHSTLFSNAVLHHAVAAVGVICLYLFSASPGTRCS